MVIFLKNYHFRVGNMFNLPKFKKVSTLFTMFSTKNEFKRRARHSTVVK